MITPRPRQAKAIEDLRSAYLFGHRAPILIAPTGFGKSATAICMIQIALDKGKRVWFIVKASAWATAFINTKEENT